MNIIVKPIDCDTLWAWNCILEEDGETWEAQAIEEDVFEVLKLASFVHDWSFPTVHEAALKVWHKL